MIESRAPGRLIYTPGEIADAVGKLALRIAWDYRRKPLVLLGVLKGALYLTVDLARAIAQIADGPSEIVVDYLCVGSYGMSDRSDGQVRLLMDASVQVTNRDVVLVDDIADKGYTLGFLQTLLKERAPASLRTCVLFDKPSARVVEVPLEYVGLPAPDAFVVGYGLDYQERFRSLPYVAAIDPKTKEESSSPST